MAGQEGIVQTTELTMELAPPRIHRRMHLAHTIKDGWRCDEVSISIDCDWDDPINDKIHHIFRTEAKAIAETGKRIANEMNRG